jgi:hypothetical protein
MYIVYRFGHGRKKLQLKNYERGGGGFSTDQRDTASTVYTSIETLFKSMIYIC